MDAAVMTRLSVGGITGAGLERLFTLSMTRLVAMAGVKGWSFGGVIRGNSAMSF